MRHRNASTPFDQTLLALADPTRRSILERLSAGEARVTDVAADFPISLNSVSKHIRLLERAELVQRRVVGREHVLRFRPEPLDAAQDWIARKRAFWGERLAALDRLLSTQDAGRPRTARKTKTKAKRTTGVGQWRRRSK